MKFRLLSLLLCACALTLGLTGTGHAASPEVLKAIQDLGLPVEGIRAMETLKLAFAEDLPLIDEAARGTNLLRSARAGAVLAWHNEKGAFALKDLELNLFLAALEFPPDSPEEMAEEKARGREYLLNLARQGDPASLERMLSTFAGDDYRRYAACRDVLAEAGGSPVITGARELFVSGSFYARLRAAHLLGLIVNRAPAEDADEARIAALASDKEQALFTLRELEHDAHPEVRGRVLQAFVESGDPASLQRCATFLEDLNSLVREKAVRGISEVEIDNRAGLLVGALSDEAFPVRFAAAEGLASMPEEAKAALASTELDKGQMTLLASISGKIDPEGALATLKTMLESDNWELRSAAVSGLVDCGEAGMALIEELDKTETHPFVRHKLEMVLWGRADFPPADPALFGTSDEELFEREVGTAGIALLPEEAAALDSALSALMMTRADLRLDRGAELGDIWRMGIVKETLADPLEIAPALKELTESLETVAQETPLQAFVRAALPLFMEDSYPPVEPQQQDLNQLRLLPKPLRGMVSTTVGRIGRVRFELGIAFAGLTEADRKLVAEALTVEDFDVSLELVVAAEELDMEALRRAAVELAAIEAEWADPQWRKTLTEYGAEHTDPLYLDTALGLIVIGGGGEDRFFEKAMLILDPGGNDVYENQGGAWNYDKPGSCAVIVDLNGDDIYRETGLVGCGSGVLGAGMLIDCQGDDTYLSGKYGQGAALFGVGLLRDEAGDDTYRADQMAQGAGAFGIAGLVDSAGNDFYTAYGFCQGFAFSGAFGALVDKAGNDLYFMGGKYLQYDSMPSRHLNMGQGAAYGFRPHSSGGVALLYDKSGDDHYQGEAYSQGTAYWFGFGACVDLEGSDTYSAEIYSLASGIHYGVGAFADLQGDDNYTSWGLSVSGSHDRGVSLFIEGGGDDQYSVRDTSIGGAINDAVSIFIDAGGRDGYLARNSGGLGAGEWRGSKSNSIGIFLDLGGREDTYDGLYGANGRWWTQGWYGIAIDR